MIFIDFIYNKYLVISGTLSNDNDFFVVDFMQGNTLQLKKLELFWNKIKENNTVIIGYDLFDSLHFIKRKLKEESIYRNFIDLKYICKLYNIEDKFYDVESINKLITPYKNVHGSKFSYIYLPKFVINKIAEIRIANLLEFKKTIPEIFFKLSEKYSESLYKIYDNCSYLSEQKIYFDETLSEFIKNKNINVYEDDLSKYFLNEYDIYATKTGRYIYTSFNFDKQLKNKINENLCKIDYNAFEPTVALNLIGFDFDVIDKDIYEFFMEEFDNRSSSKIKLIKLMYDNNVDYSKTDNEYLRNLIIFKKKIIDEYKNNGIIFNHFGRPLKLKKGDEYYKIFSHYIQSTANDLMMEILYSLRRNFEMLNIKECQYDSLVFESNDERQINDVLEFLKQNNNFKLYPIKK